MAPSGIRDVAKRAGCSITAVSMALNGYGRVGEETRRRIVQAAAELDYTPNAAGKALKRRRTDCVGLLYHPRGDHFFSNPFYSSVLDGVEERISAAGYSLILGSCQTGDQAVGLPKFVQERGVDGLILFGWLPEEAIAAGLATGLPCVMLDNAHPGVDQVLSDGVAGGRMAVERLVAAGHRDLAAMAIHFEMPSETMRLAGYREGLDRAGLPFRPERVVRRPPSFPGLSGFPDDMVDELLALRPRPTGVFVQLDNLALMVMPRLLELGIGIPADMSVVGFDDVPQSSWLHPPLTTLRVDKVRMGWRGVELLLERLADPRLPARVELVPVEWVERATVAPPAAARFTKKRG